MLSTTTFITPNVLSFNTLNKIKTLFKKQFKTLLMSFLLLLSFQAYAMNLSEAMTQLPSAKQQGLVGEQPNGYLGVVKNSPQAAQISQLINQARKAEYQKLAQANNISLSDVELLAGQKALQKTPSGHYIQQNGQWLKKP